MGILCFLLSFLSEALEVCCGDGAPRHVPSPARHLFLGIGNALVPGAPLATPFNQRLCCYTFREEMQVCQTRCKNQKATEITTHQCSWSQRSQAGQRQQIISTPRCDVSIHRQLHIDPNACIILCNRYNATRNIFIHDRTAH